MGLYPFINFPGAELPFAKPRFILKDGALSLNLHEMGGAAGAEWGLDDEEVTLTVAPAHVGRLALALAAELLKGGSGDVKHLSEICQDHAVPCRIACWS